MIFDTLLDAILDIISCIFMRRANKFKILLGFFKRTSRSIIINIILMLIVFYLQFVSLVEPKLPCSIDLDLKRLAQDIFTWTMEIFMPRRCNGVHSRFTCVSFIFNAQIKMKVYPIYQNKNKSQDLHDNTFYQKIFQSTIMSQKAKSLLSETVTFTMGHQ